MRSTHENCGTSQAGFLHPHDETADSFRLSALSLHSTHENCGKSGVLRPHEELLTVSGLKLRNVSGFLHRHDEIPDSLTLRIRLCTPHKECADSPRPRALHPRKSRNVSGSPHPHDETAESFRLSALSVHSTHENRGTPQALPTTKLPTVPGPAHFPRIPLAKKLPRVSDFCAALWWGLPTVSGSVRSLRGGVSGFLRPR